MHYTQVCQNPAIYEIRVPFANVSTNATNCYVVEDGEACLVIDTGAPSDAGYEYLYAAFEELRLFDKQIAFFLTHFHIDHAGLVDRIAPKGSIIYVSSRDARVAKGNQAQSFAEMVFARLISEGVSSREAVESKRMRLESEQVDISHMKLAYVEEGCEIPVGRYSLQVVGTEGHTPGHLSLFEPQSKTLFGGDHMLYVISPSIDLFPDSSDSVAIYLQNLRKVRNMPVERFCVSHGENRSDFVERIDWLIRHHEERLDELVGIVSANPGMTGYDVIKAVAWNVPFDNWDEISLLQRCCIVGEGAVLLDHLVVAGRTLRHREADGIFRYMPTL